jgi:hypothetical protein
MPRAASIGPWATESHRPINAQRKARVHQAPVQHHNHHHGHHWQQRVAVTMTMLVASFAWVVPIAQATVHRVTVPYPAKLAVAGVYRVSDGALVRVVWTKRDVAPGTHTVDDDTDDVNGNRWVVGVVVVGTDAVADAVSHTVHPITRSHH